MMGVSQSVLRILPLLAIFSLCALAQDALRVDVNLVNVFATVQNQRGESVSGLTADDFRVYDDDVQQQISVFEKEDQVQSAIAILIDTSGSTVDVLSMIKKGTLEFAQATKRFDDLCVFSFGTAVHLIHDFREPVRDLRVRLESLRPYGTTVLFDALTEAMRKVREREQERKALIVISDGNDNGSVSGFGAVSDAAQRSGALIYFVAIGSRVLVDEHTVESLAALSGGRVIYMAKTDSIPTALDAIREELRKQYYLGYYVSRRPGPHRIRVEIPSRTVRIRAKPGYTD
jgi:Ca-activated chloride channel family protein